MPPLTPFQYVEYGKQALEPPNRPQGSVLPPSLAVGNQLNAYKTVTNTTTTTTTTSVISKVTNTSIVSSRVWTIFF